VTSLVNTQPLQDFFAVASTYDAKPHRTVSLNHLGISVLANPRRRESRDTVTPIIVTSTQTAGIAWTVALKLQAIFANYIESVTRDDNRVYIRFCNPFRAARWWSSPRGSQ
jgi:hypothetical protein